MSNPTAEKRLKRDHIPRCSEPGCKKAVYADGLCWGHYRLPEAPRVGEPEHDCGEDTCVCAD